MARYVDEYDVVLKVNDIPVSFIYPHEASWYMEYIRAEISKENKVEIVGISDIIERPVSPL